MSLTVEEVRNRLDHMRDVLRGETGDGEGERAEVTNNTGSPNGLQRET